MKKIAVFFKEKGSKDYPLNKENYLIAYQELAAEIEDLGHELYIVRHNSTYKGEGNFSKSWQLKNNQIQETGSIKADVILDKGEFQSDEKVKVLNSSYVNKVCTDKYLTYKLFSKFCPETIQVANETEFIEALKQIKTEQKVIKPLDGEEGNGVYIGNSKYLIKSPRIFPLLVQEFLDTSEGIPNIYKGIHDLRLVYINGELIYSFYRTPPDGSLLANVAQGGTLTIIPNNKIPKKVIQISKIIKENFQGDYYFGVDIGFVKGNPKIIELNSRLGLHPSKLNPMFKVFTKKIAELLVKMSQS